MSGLADDGKISLSFVLALSLHCVARGFHTLPLRSAGSLNGPGFVPHTESQLSIMVWTYGGSSAHLLRVGGRDAESERPISHTTHFTVV